MKHNAKVKTKIWELITKDTWCKGAYHKAKNNGKLAHCAIGWIQVMYPATCTDQKSYESRKEAEEKFRNAINKECIVAWNDRGIRTFKQVKAAFKKADI